MGNLFQGALFSAQDFQTYSFDGLTDLTPTGSTGQAIITNGITVINYPLAVTAVLPSGIETITQQLYIKNTLGATGTTTISGTTAGQTIDGGLTITLAGANTKAHLINYSGQAWVTI
jgi:hypothetical protein